VLTITAVSAGSVEYLLAGSGCAEHEHTGAGERAASAAGARYLVDAAGREAAGVWSGECAAMVGIAAGSPAAPEDVRRVFGALIHPASDVEDPVFLGPSGSTRSDTASTRSIGGR
jgi:hypothetical protein